MTWGPDGLLYVVDMTTKAVYTIDPVTKAVTPFATGFTDPYDLEFDSQGNLYVLELQTGQIIKILSTAAVFTETRLIDTIPTKDVEFLLSSATTAPYSITMTGDDAVVEWRLNNVTTGKDRSISYDLKLTNLLPGENRLVDRSLELIYKDLNNQEIKVDLPTLSVHVLASAFTGTLSTEKSAYQAGEDVVIGGSITNLSDYARTIDINVLIEDGSGSLVKEITALSGLTFSAGDIKSLANLTFNIGSTIAGDYRVHLVLVENGKTIGDVFTDFKIQRPVIAVSAKATVDKLTYLPREIVTISPVITSLSLNYSFENLNALVSISSPTGLILTSELKSIANLMPEASFAFKSYWNTGTYTAGTYPVTLEVKDTSGALLASGSAEVTIAASADPKALLKGTVTVDKQSVLSGEPVAVNYSITNAGNIDFTGINLSVQILHVVEQTVYATLTGQTSLTMGATYTHSGQISTQDYSAKDYLVVLRANIGGIDQTLAGTYFRVEGAPSGLSLVAPSTASDVETLTPILTVNNAADPNDDKLTYEYELYGDSGLTQVVVSTNGLTQGTGITSWTVPLSLTENQTYYWRSRAYDGKLYGPWMPPATFRVNTVNDPPTAPIPTSPAEGQSVSTLTPQLTVNNASDPDSPSQTYNFQVALDPDFTQIAASTVGVFPGQGTTSWQVPTGLSENTWYFWRAQADDWLTTGSWSTTASFFVNTTNEAPTVPAILAPASNTVVASLGADIMLANSTDPDSPVISYAVELDTVPTFDSTGIIRSGAIAQGIGSTTWHAAGLRDNTLYYVRAKASDGTASSSWSSVISFFVNTANDAPTAPILQNPSIGAGVSAFTPLLSVHNATDLDRDTLTYEFEVYSDAGLLSRVANAASVVETAGITSWTVAVPLMENHTYWWRARAFDAQAYGPWMQIGSFTVNTANDAPGAPALYSPLDGATIATFLPTLQVANAVDQDSSVLTYDFEIYNGTTLAWSRTGVSQDPSGTTAVSVTTTLADNTTYQWRARAYDGDRYGPWMAMAAFTVHVQQVGINVTIDVEPETLNKKGNGNWVMVEIELPHGYHASDVDISSIRLEGVVHAETRPYDQYEHHYHSGCDHDHAEHNHDEIKVKFDRDSVIGVLPTGDHVPVHVTGRIGNATFEGVDFIRVIH